MRLAASLAIDAAPSSYQSNAEMAVAAGANIDEIVGTLIASSACSSVIAASAAEAGG